MTHTPECCSPERPHASVYELPQDGQTHHVGANGGRVTYPPPLPAETTAERLAAAEAKIDAALKALRLTDSSKRWNEWVNGGIGPRAAHEARIALGADQ